jgi:cytochrome c556
VPTITQNCKEKTAMSFAHARKAVLFSLVYIVFVGAAALYSQVPVDKGAPPAPAADLTAQLDAYIAEIDQALADPKAYDLAKQSRTWKNANTLVVLALVLANHPEQHPLKGSSAAIAEAAGGLAAAAETSASEAQAALAKIKEARAGKAAPVAAPKWENAASVPALMKQVPLVHAGLRRGVAPNRLAKLATASAGQAATLAAIAEVSMHDKEYGTTPELAAQWTAMCAEMRDASGEVNSAVHALDQARVDAGMKRLLQSCDACHARFRQQ